MACFHGANSPKEGSFSVTAELGSPRFLPHSAGYPSVLVPKPAQNASIVSPPHATRALRAAPVLPPPPEPRLPYRSDVRSPCSTGSIGGKPARLCPQIWGYRKCLSPCSLENATCSQLPAPAASATWVPPAVAPHGTSNSTKFPRPLCPLQVGRQLLSDRPRAREDVQASLQCLSSTWEELKHKLAEQGDRLRQARQLLGLLQVCRRGAGRRRETEAALGQAGGGGNEQDRKGWGGVWSILLTLE